MSDDSIKIIEVDGFHVVAETDSSREGREQVRRLVREAAAKAREEFKKNEEPKYVYAIWELLNGGLRKRHVSFDTADEAFVHTTDVLDPDYERMFVVEVEKA